MPHGLTWTEPASGKRRQLAWGAARAFFLVADDGDPTAPPASFHVLLGAGPPPVWQTPTPEDPHQWAAHSELCRIIVTESRLPLRDLSTVSEQLAQAVRAATHVREDALEEHLEREAAAAVPGISLARIRAGARRQWRLVLALEAPYALLFAAGLVGSILQHFGIG